MSTEREHVWYFPKLIERSRYGLPAVVRATVKDRYDRGGRVDIVVRTRAGHPTDLLFKAVPANVTGPVNHIEGMEGTALNDWRQRLAFLEWRRNWRRARHLHSQALRRLYLGHRRPVSQEGLARYAD